MKFSQLLRITKAERNNNFRAKTFMLLLISCKIKGDHPLGWPPFGCYLEINNNANQNSKSAGMLL